MYKPLESSDLAVRLRERSPAIEQTILVRAHAVADPATVHDPGYRTGLRAAVRAAVAYGIAALEEGEERLAPIPAELLAQARHAARSGVSLDTVLRRYVAGHALFGEFVIQEVEAAGGLASGSLRAALGIEAAVLDHLIDAVSAEYRRELAARS